MSSSILILLGNGDGTFGSPLVPLTGPGYFTIATGDFNNDGVPDLAVATDGSLSQTSSGVTILLGNGDGTFRTASVSAISSIGYTLVAADSIWMASSILPCPPQILVVHKAALRSYWVRATAECNRLSLTA